MTNAAFQPKTPVAQVSVFNAEASEAKGELAVSFGGMTLEDLAALLRAQQLQVRRQPPRPSNRPIA